MKRVFAAFSVLIALSLVYLIAIRPGQVLKQSVKDLPEVQEFLKEHPNAVLSGKLPVENATLEVYGEKLPEEPLSEVIVKEQDKEIKIYLGKNNKPVHIIETWKCGNGVCDERENCAACAEDCQCAAIERCEERVCKTYCGNEVCDQDEGCDSCLKDCAKPRNHSVCLEEVAYWFDSCGNRGELMKSCAKDEECLNGTCHPRCGNHLCEPEVGEDCTTCIPDCGCQKNKRCENSICVTFCGNGECNLLENCGDCAVDCGCGNYSRCENNKCSTWCGNNRCDATETCDSCKEDCGCPSGQRCEDAVCTTWCGNRICEDNEGCGACVSDCACGSNARCFGNECATKSGETEDIMAIGASRHYDVGQRSYDVVLNFVDSSQAKFTVNGATTPLLSAGQTHVLPDSMEFTLDEILYQSYAGGIQSARFTLTTFG